MLQEKKYELSHHFSELENLQKEKTLTYCVVNKDGNTTISLKGITLSKTYTESCLLPDTDFSYAEKIAILLCENCFDISTWKNLLDDIQVKYIVTKSDLT